MALTPPNERFSGDGLSNPAVRRAHAAAAQARRSHLIARYPHVEMSSDAPARRWPLRARLAFLLAATAAAWALLAFGVFALLR